MTSGTSTSFARVRASSVLPDPVGPTIITFVLSSTTGSTSSPLDRFNFCGSCKSSEADPPSRVRGQKHPHYSACDKALKIIKDARHREGMHVSVSREISGPSIRHNERLGGGGAGAGS